MITTKLGMFSNISHHPLIFLHFRYVQRIVNYSFIFFINFYLENFDADVAIMMEMWDIATGNQGERGLESFFGTMNINCSVKLPFPIEFNV